MKEAEITQADIDMTRSLYIPVAVQGRILYFCLSDLQYIDTMYQYSLEWFVEIFNNSILATEKSGSLNILFTNYLPVFISLYTIANIIINYLSHKLNISLFKGIIIPNTKCIIYVITLN